MALFGKFAAVVLIPLTLFLFTMVCEKQDKPYMDEIFHYSQALKYLEGKYFEWDPKITTPPGLYVIANGILLPLWKIIGIDVQNLTAFRAVNVLFTLGNFFAIYLILQKLHHKDTPEELFLLSSLNLTILPTVYFFTFLFYTDCGSVFFVLLMYLFHLNQHQWIASLFGAISVLFRQTNIIWMFFVAAHPVHQMLLQKLQKIPSAPKVRSSSSKSRSWNFFRKQRSKILFHLQYWMPVTSQIVYINIGYLITALCFVAFVWVNKSLVLGDKFSHEAGFNLPQLFYFALYSLFFASPYLITVPNLKAFLRMLTKYTFLVILILAGIALSVRYLTYEHPYLLADNRHFTFYIWRKILNCNLYLTHLLMPLGIYSGYMMFYQMKHKDTVWKCLFVFCLLLSVVPQRLFELRYFNVAFIMFRLHIKLKCQLHLVLEFMLFVFINAIAMYLFLEKPFHDNDAMQRFMW